MTEANDGTIKQRLKHFQVALESDKSNDNSFIKWAIDKLGSFQPKCIGSDALRVAYLNGNLKAFNKLLDYGAEYTLKNRAGLTVLHSIVVTINNNSYTHGVSYGLNRLALTSLKDSFITAILTLHVKHGQTENPCDPNGLSHFHVACMANHVEAVQFFLENGVSIHEAVNLLESPLFACYTPLHLAVNYLSFEVLEVLSKQRAGINTIESKGITLLHLLLERNLKANKTSDTLSLLPQERELSKKISRLLLTNTSVADKDAMINDDSGLSYLHVASAMMDVLDVEQVIHKFNNINQCINMESTLWPGYTALHFAAVFNLDIVKLLVKQGADLEAKDAQGVTPLDLCLERYKMDDIHCILSLVSKWKNIQFSDGQTKLLDLISAMRSHELFKKFLKKPSMKALIFLPNNSLWPGFTPMHLLILLAKSTGNLYNKNSQVVHKTYIEMISDLYVKNTEIIEAQDSHGHTPLHLCFRLGKMKNVRNWLMNLHERDNNLIDCVDEDNLSFIHIACAHHTNTNFLRKLLLKNNKFYNVNRVYKGKSIEKLIIHEWTPLDVAINSVENDSYSSLNEDLNKEIIETLLGYGANANVKKVYDVMCTHFLVITNFDPDSNETQVNDKVDYNILLSLIQPSAGNHLERVARYCGEVESLKKLVDNGTDVIRIINSLPRTYYDLSNRQYVNNSLLHIANSCRYKPVYFFIQRGANILVTNCDKNMLTKILLGDEPLLKVMQNIPDLRIQLKKGPLTELHIACRDGDTSRVETLLNNGANINAKVRSDSPICPGYTPLHICIQSRKESDTNTLKLLLQRGADVTLKNAKQRTPLHMAYQHYIGNLYYCGPNELDFERVTMLLKAQKNFKVNPTSSEGITHFHIACSLADVLTVKNFLNYGNVENDQPIDFSFSNSRFKTFPGAGCTPLHLAVLEKNNEYCGKKFVEFSWQLQTVDLLLKHGANVNAENAWGNTPFRTADCFEIRERLVRGGADVSLKNAIGHTPLKGMLLEGPESSDQIEYFLRCGCLYNEFDAHTKIGLIALTLRSLPLVEMQRLLSMAISNFPNVIKVDEFGRTVIHNLVSIYQINASATDYTTLIELLLTTGCDVDDQDHLGRTALHITVEFKNIRAISGLLLAGADINKTNVNGQTPFARQFQSCTRCEQPTDAEDEQCQHYRVFKLLALQVKKLQSCGLDVHRINQDIVATGFPGFSYVNVNEQFLDELEALKNIKIEPHSLTLHSFMSELDIVADYPTMSQMKRNAINQFFRPRECYRQFREKYSEVAGLLELQYRKAVMRTELLQKGEISLNCLAKISIPTICSRIILRFLKNSELEHLVATGENIV